MIDPETELVYPELERQERKFRVLAGLYVLLVALVVGYLLMRRPWAVRKAPVLPTATPSSAPLPLALVNGEPVTRDELITELMLADGVNAMRRLVQEKILLQTGQKNHITLDDPVSLQRLNAVHERQQDPASYLATDEEIRARLVLRRLLLKDQSEARKRQVYELFKPELTQYEIFTVLVASLKDAQQFRSAHPCGTSFEQQGHRLGFMTLSQIRDQLGERVAESVQDMVDHDRVMSNPVSAPNGVGLLKIGSVKSGYEDLKSSVEDLIAGSQRAEFLYNLGRAAKVEYPNVPDAAGPVVAPSSGSNPFAAPTSNIFAEPSAIKAGSSGVFAPLPSANKSRGGVFAPPKDQ